LIIFTLSRHRALLRISFLHESVTTCGLQFRWACDCDADPTNRNESFLFLFLLFLTWLWKVLPLRDLKSPKAIKTLVVGVWTLFRWPWRS